MNPTDNPGTGPATDGLLARVHIIEDGRYKGKEQAIDPSKIFPSGTRGARWIHVPVNDLDWMNFPYMSWMTYGKYQNPRTKYGSSNHATITSKIEFSAEEKETPSKDQKSSSVSKILTSWPLFRTIKRPQYLRRTLDQFYYPSLTDTSARDKDQTISKWSGTPLEQHGRNEAATDSAMIMVDQFWCWIIDKNTIITSFPSGIYSDSPSGVQDLYLGIVKSLTNHPQQLETVEDMYSLLIKEAAGYMFNGVNMSSVDMMGIYRWVTGDKAATQTTYFQEFQKGYASGGHDKTIFNDRHDLKLVLEVADIIDELKVRAPAAMHIRPLLTRDGTL
ncbi:hypothetical protein AA0113_g9593 [Alternaria arborescens]|uniref:Uncharacterized protein n=1 Tax=Alternaria arborescens TaxID=156630 RepID=A0A4Q4R9D8_9PLEO|nr:hypothetical protein AA0113_g9593 [Alternaria arborescens]